MVFCLRKNPSYLQKKLPCVLPAAAFVLSLKREMPSPYKTDISFAEDHSMSNNLWREHQKIRDLFFLFSTDEYLATELDIYGSCS